MGTFLNFSLSSVFKDEVRNLSTLSKGDNTASVSVVDGCLEDLEVNICVSVFLFYVKMAQSEDLKCNIHITVL